MTIFLPSLLLVTLFRRSRPRHPRAISLVAEAVEKIRKTSSHGQQAMNPSMRSKRKFLFPWWCLILAYVLSVLFVAVSIFFVAIRGIQYGNVRVGQWLGSIVTGFFASIFLTQPLKVISLALLFMCFCRKKNRAEAFIEEEDPIADFTVSAEDVGRKFPVSSERNVSYFHSSLFCLIEGQLCSRQNTSGSSSFETWTNPSAATSWTSHERNPFVVHPPRVVLAVTLSRCSLCDQFCQSKCQWSASNRQPLTASLLRARYVSSA